jgi:septum formation protein
MHAHSFVYLASQSPRRAQLLDLLGVQHQPLLPDAQEDAEALEAEVPGELPLHYVQRVTLAKLQAARQRLQRRGLPAAPILCADTTVALGRRILAKPQDAAQAAEMLAALSGRSHRVLTAVAVAAGRHTLQRTSLSRVRFAVLGAATIQRYIASGEPFGKAGAYAIQGALAGHIAHITGSHSGIMGLPMFEAATLLREAGVRMSL